MLVVDDDLEMAHCVAEILETEKCRCETAVSGSDALLSCRENDFDVVVSDVRMAEMDGIELMTRLKHLQSDLPVILMTAEGSIPAAIDAVKRGAFQYITKPVAARELRRLVDQAVTARASVEPPPSSKRAFGHTAARATGAATYAAPRGTEELIGESLAMRELRARIELVGSATSPVLIVGETGTGKELVARAIHACSARASKPFVTVNAAAIPETLLESEMFGHVRGAFTGAFQTHRGLLAEADGGTLLLDEIGDMPLGLQAKLLRVLQSGEIRAVGGDRIQKVDVRIVAATHRRLPELVREGRFRDDLYYRLNVINIAVPPLRSRVSDIPDLAARFLALGLERAPASRVRSISPELLDLLRHGAWPGNVRELQSTIERLVVLALTTQLEPRHLALVDDELKPVTGAPVTRPLGEELCCIDDLVRRHVEAVLVHTDGNKARAAKILGIDLSTLYRWQQKWQP